MKIALVHDWLTGMRGGEKVLAELLDLFPSADLFTLLWRRGSVSAAIEARVRGVSFLQHLPRATAAYRYYLPLFPAAIRSLDLSGYQVVLSSSHAVAKSVKVPRAAIHLSYVHTPMRYLWEVGDDYFRFGRGRWWKRIAFRGVAPWLRRFDRNTAFGVHYFIANSENVRARIRRVYGADAHVIYPPVDTDFFTPGPRPGTGNYYLVVAPAEPYKRVDLAVDAFSGGDRRLVIVSKGTLAGQLRKRARQPVEFMADLSHERLRDLYRDCRALVFPGREDFGMAAAEAQACGRPVICYSEGGVPEIVEDGRTGLHFRAQTAQALREAVRQFEIMDWDPALIRANSLRFSRREFRSRMAEFCTGQAGLPPECMNLARVSQTVW